MHRTLVNLNPANEFRAIEDMFESLFGTPSGPSPSVTSLAVDITEYDGVLYVRAAVPGVSPENLDVSIEKNVLTIRGESQQQTLGENEKVYRREVSYGAFARSVRLPEGLDLEKVEASFKHGLVTICLPRVPEEKPKSIKVNIRNEEPTLSTPSVESEN